LSIALPAGLIGRYHSSLNCLPIRKRHWDKIILTRQHPGFACSLLELLNEWGTSIAVPELVDIAAAYETAGHWNRSIDLYEAIIDRHKRTLGDDYPDTLQWRVALAELLQRAGHLDKAIVEYEDVLDDRRLKYGNGDRSSISIMHSLGNAYYRKKEFAKASRVLKDCVEVLNYNYRSSCGWLICDAEVSLGAALREQQRYEEAERLLTESYKRQRAASTVMRAEDYQRIARTAQELASLYMACNKQDESAIYTKSAAEYKSKGTRKWETDYSNIGNYYGRGETRFAKRDFESAIADYSEAIRLDPQSVLAFFGRADAWQEKGEHDKAIDDYTEAIRLDAKYAKAYLRRASAWGRKGRYDEAAEDYGRYLRFDRNSDFAFASRGRAYALLGRFDEAIADYNEALSRKPSDQWTYLSRGRAWQQKGDFGRAIADYYESLRLSPKDTSALNARATARQSRGHYPDAIADFAHAQELDPKNPFALNGMAWLRATCPDERFRDGAKAVEDATRACELSDWKSAAYLDTLAAAYAEAGNFAKAIEWQNKALVLASEELQAQLRAHLELYQSGKPYREDPAAAAASP
jgi:tetratricopeptide (TPR) repeat protein